MKDVRKYDREFKINAVKLYQEAKISIFEYIEVFYNRQRIHSTTGYETPEAFEKQRGKMRSSAA